MYSLCSGKQYILYLWVMEVPYVVVRKDSFEVFLCTSKKAVAKRLGVTYQTLRRRFGWSYRDEYGDWVVWSGLEVERQKKGFGG